MGWFTKDTEGMSWHEAEGNAARLMRTWGYERVKVSPPGPDEGIDVTARGAVAQVKHYQKPVSRPKLQEFVGASGGKMMLYFVLSGYTRQAVDYANQHEIALFQYDTSGAARAINGAARKVGHPGGAQGFDRSERAVLAVAPGLKPYLEQRCAWGTAAVSGLGTVIVPVSYGSGLGVVKTVLMMIALGLIFIVAIAVLLDRGESAEEAKTRQDAREAHTFDGRGTAASPSGDLVSDASQPREPALLDSSGTLWAAGFFSLALLAAPFLALRWNGGGWWWLPYGIGWAVCWIMVVGLVSLIIDGVNARKNPPDDTQTV